MLLDLYEMRRIVVVGMTGSGKTTLAGRLAALLGVRHIELDGLYWHLPNWQPPADEEFLARVASHAASERWIVDGNYSKARDLLWPRADVVVWLDYSLWTVLSQLIIRTVRRITSQEILWSTNRESFRSQFLSRDSLVLYAFRGYRTRRKRYEALMRSNFYPELRWIRLYSPNAAEQWLRVLEFRVERATGIEPVRSAWEADMPPQHLARQAREV